jgi:hypothetical protein
MAAKKDESKTEGSTAATRSTYAGSSNQPQQQQFQGEENYQVNRSIDETKANIRRSIEEARREIPEYAQSVTDYHQQAMDSAQEITDNYLDSQKEIINSVQSSWTNYIDTVYWWLSPRKLSDIYTQTVSNMADNAVSGTRIWNKTVLANMDASKAYLGRAREASREISKINTNTTRTLERTSDQMSPGHGQRQGRYSEGRQR